MDSVLWEVDTSCTVTFLADCTHSVALLCNLNKKRSPVVTLWLLAVSVSGRDGLLPHLPYKLILSFGQVSLVSTVVVPMERKRCAKHSHYGAEQEGSSPNGM